MSSKIAKKQQEEIKITSSKSQMIKFDNKTFTGSSAGLLALLPYIRKFGIYTLIENSDYPQTGQIVKLNSILSFVALKESDIKRYAVDKMWCIDRSLGLFAGLNVLPKVAWFSSTFIVSKCKKYETQIYT